MEKAGGEANRSFAVPQYTQRTAETAPAYRELPGTRYWVGTGMVVVYIHTFMNV